MKLFKVLIGCCTSILGMAFKSKPQASPMAINAATIM